MLSQSGKRVLVLAALLLIVVVASAVYLNETNPETQERRRLQLLRETLNPPSSAEYLGKRTYNATGDGSTVYTWRDQATLYEALVTQEGATKTFTYTLQQGELNATMSPLLAQALSEKLFTEATQALPGYFEVTGPTPSYIQYFNLEEKWQLYWGLKLANYTVFGADFIVRVSTQTGEVAIYHNSLDKAIELTVPEPPIITKEQAIAIAAESYRKQLVYPIILSNTSRGLGVTSSEFNEVPVNTLIWRIDVRGIGYEQGSMVHAATVYLIDAHTGETYIGVTEGAGAVWSLGIYPYYGSAYPITRIMYPQEYPFPVTMAEAKGLVLDHALERIPGRLAWELIVLQLDDDNRSIIVSYWARTSGEYKTGALASISSLRQIEWNSQVLDGYLMVIDAETGELIQETEYRNIGEPANQLGITREQAVNITSTSPLADPDNKIITAGSLELAEPRIIKPDWISQLTYTGDFRRLYIAEVNQTEPRLYWIIEYALYPEVHGGYTGTYLVDAETGQIALAKEDYPLPNLIFRGYAPETLSIKRGETVSFNITVKAAATLEAQLPVTLTPERIPEGVTALIHGETKQLSNQKTATFMVTLTAADEAAMGTYMVIFDLRLPGRGTGVNFDLVITD
jgi:hypothetical protein